MPKTTEDMFFSPNGQRQRGEMLLVYISRKSALALHLANAGVPLRFEAKGYIMMRDAKMSPSLWDMVQRWTTTRYRLEDVHEVLRRLEGPIASHGGRPTTQLGARTEAGPRRHTRPSTTRVRWPLRGKRWRKCFLSCDTRCGSTQKFRRN